MAAFQTSSKWLKLAFLEVHLALFLFLFPMAAVGSMTIGPASVLTVTGLLLLTSCILTYTWVFVKEIYNNRLIHLGTLVSNFLVGIFGIVSVIVLFQWRDSSRVDNVIEASIGTAILGTVAGIFVLTEMKGFRLPFPRRKLKNIKVDPAKKDETKNDAVETADNNMANSSRAEVGEIPQGEKTVNGPFYKRSMWLKYSLYLFGLSLFFNFLPTEPVMIGGAREVTSLVYFCSILAITFLFCWVFLSPLSKNRGLHVLTAVTVFLTGFFSFVLMVIWLVNWSMLHPFTPVLLFTAGLLACLSGAATVLEIRQHKLRTKTRYLDRECTASCFNSLIRVFGIPGVNVTVDEDNDMNGDVAERYAATPRILTTPDTPVKNKDPPPQTPVKNKDPPPTPVKNKNPPPTDRKRESIMNVDNSDHHSTNSDINTMKKNLENDGKIIAGKYQGNGRVSQKVGGAANKSFDPVPDGYNSPRRTASPPFSDNYFDEREENRNYEEDAFRESQEFTFPDEIKVPVPPSISVGHHEVDGEREKRFLHKQNRNELITGRQSTDDLPPVSGMGGEAPRKAYNPFEDDD